MSHASESHDPGSPDIDTHDHLDHDPDAAPSPLPRDAGMATAEYAIATLAACGFAGLLVALLSGGEVQQLLFGIVRRALSVG